MSELMSGHLDYPTKCDEGKPNRRREGGDPGTRDTRAMTTDGTPGAQGRPENVTLRMVAAHAGVSKSVVSRVLQDSSRVSPASREAVLSAIDELGYRPNSLARSLTQRLSLIHISEPTRPY